MVSEWFINYELALAIAMISCIPLFGSLLNGVVTPGVYQSFTGDKEDSGEAFGTTMLIGFFM
jgi:hypothetical protein